MIDCLLDQKHIPELMSLLACFTALRDSMPVVVCEGIELLLALRVQPAIQNIVTWCNISLITGIVTFRGAMEDMNQ